MCRDKNSPGLNATLIDSFQNHGAGAVNIFPHIFQIISCLIITFVFVLSVDFYCNIYICYYCYLDWDYESMDAPQYHCFKKGFKVEVCFDEVGFRGSWYTATILETPSKRAQKVFLEFDTLVEDDNHKKPLRQHVNYLLVRPVSPRDPNPFFQLDDEVDAFHNDGWWEGVITHIIHPPPDADGVAAAPRYSVFFRSSREQIDFPASDLRFHREWLYGEWVPPLKENAAASVGVQPNHPKEAVPSREASLTSSAAKPK